MPDRPGANAAKYLQSAEATWKGVVEARRWDGVGLTGATSATFDAFGVGNGSPWNQAYRSPGGGDNLYLSSIVALKPKTGDYVWHYQTTPGETWDFTATQHIILADLNIGGQTRKVLMQAPKNGFFYVLDRTNGKLISAKPYTTITWASGVDMATGRPIEIHLEARIERPGNHRLSCRTRVAPTIGAAWPEVR